MEYSWKEVGVHTPTICFTFLLAYILPTKSNDWRSKNRERSHKIFKEIIRYHFFIFIWKLNFILIYPLQISKLFIGFCFNFCIRLFSEVKVNKHLPGVQLNAEFNSKANPFPECNQLSQE